MADNSLHIEVVLIGGSAGSLPVLIQILKLLNTDFRLPVVIVIHRQRNVLSELSKILSTAIPTRTFIEPDDKVSIEENCIYIAPQNYHLLIEADKTVSLDYSEAIQYSRPSIDVTFESAAAIYKNKLVSILLSGANSDGTEGNIMVSNNGGIAIAQDPATAGYPVMPLSAIKSVKGIKVMTPEKIGDFLNALTFKGK